MSGAHRAVQLAGDQGGGMEESSWALNARLRAFYFILKAMGSHPVGGQYLRRERHSQVIGVD